MSKTFFKWLGAIFTAVLVFLLTSYLKGDKLDGADNIITKVKMGIPKVIDTIIPILSSRIAILLYGVVLGCLLIAALRKFNSRSKEDNKEESRVLQMGGMALDLARQMELRHRANLQHISMSVVDASEEKLNYTGFFDNLRFLKIIDAMQIDYSRAMNSHVLAVTKYLAEIGHLLRRGDLARAKAVDFPLALIKENEIPKR